MVHTYSLEHHVDAIWKSRALPKVRAFAWKMMSNSVAVRERLVRLGVQVPLGCPICGNPETILHMISVCMWVQGIWEALLGLSGAVLGGSSVQEWLSNRLTEPKSSEPQGRTDQPDGAPRSRRAGQSGR